MPEKRHQVVIVGAGFGGLWAARSLRDSPVDVLLLDRNNYHTFFPLLYQVAAAELEPENIANPVRSILRNFKNVRFSMTEVRGLDPTGKVVETSGGSVPYDYLILATGSTTNYFGVPGAAQHSFPLRTLEEGIALRNHILGCFERAIHEPDSDRRGSLLTFVIVGGGPTGVEFAGALSELVQGPLKKDFPTLDVRQVRVMLLEASGGLLSVLPERLRRYAAKRVGRMRIEVRLEATVSSVAPEAVHLAGGDSIATETVVWTGGVRGDDQVASWGLPMGQGNRIAVQPTLQAPGFPETYVVGDLASLTEDGKPLPMVAPLAVQQGVAAARNIGRQISGKPLEPFRYRNLGTMAVIGRNAAVAHLFNRWAFTGFFAWVIWLGIHLFKLIGFRNRFLVVTGWAWDYVFFERVMRLILPTEGGDMRPR